MKYFVTLLILIFSNTSYSKVEECYRKAQIIKGLVTHHWLKTDTKIAGMGSGETANEQIGDKFEAPYSTHVFIVDHSDQIAESCKEITYADEDCVNAELDLGKPLGHFSLGNNCQTFVSKVLRKCSKDNKQIELFLGKQS